MRDEFRRSTFYLSMPQSLERRERHRRLYSQPAGYSLVRSQNIATVGLWLAGINGAALAVSFAFMIQSYTSIRNDCESRWFATETLHQALFFARGFACLGVLALVAVWLPAMVGGVRNIYRRSRDPQPPLLRPKHELDGLSEGLVEALMLLQWPLVFVSGLFTVALVVSPLFLKPDALVSQTFEKIEQACHHENGTT